VVTPLLSVFGRGGLVGVVTPLLMMEDGLLIGMVFCLAAYEIAKLDAKVIASAMKTARNRFEFRDLNI
jgi:hypothetical protein